MGPWSVTFKSLKCMPVKNTGKITIGIAVLFTALVLVRPAVWAQPQQPNLYPVFNDSAGFFRPGGNPVQNPGFNSFRLPASVVGSSPVSSCMLRGSVTFSKPFFCRLEDQLGKRVQVPVKFRLGSVEYVDWLEQKPNALPQHY